MKKFSILVLVLVLTVFSLTGCRRPGNETEPTTVPTTEAMTTPTVMPTTEATTRPTDNTENGTNATDGAMNPTENTDATVLPDDVMPDGTAATGEGRARHTPRNR